MIYFGVVNPVYRGRQLGDGKAKNQCKMGVIFPVRTDIHKVMEAHILCTAIITCPSHRYQRPSQVSSDGLFTHIDEYSYLWSVHC